jgi:hypothetical protein
LDKQYHFQEKNHGLGNIHFGVDRRPPIYILADKLEGVVYLALILVQSTDQVLKFGHPVYNIVPEQEFLRLVVVQKLCLGDVWVFHQDQRFVPQVRNIGQAVIYIRQVVVQAGCLQVV